MGEKPKSSDEKETLPPDEKAPVMPTGAALPSMGAANSWKDSLETGSLRYNTVEAPGEMANEVTRNCGVSAFSLTGAGLLPSRRTL